MIVQDKELEKTFLYFMFAKEFGWTPDIVDLQDSVLIREFAEIMQQIKKRENENGR